MMKKTKWTYLSILVLDLEMIPPLQRKFLSPDLTLQEREKGKKLHNEFIRTERNRTKKNIAISDVAAL